jgi:uroporphyrinogen III methyltransferase/synthase
MSAKKPVKQNDINMLLVKHASTGKTVVRLKGGDPLIFGRGGEEALTLFEHGIDFEFVPGVSAGNAVPAYAGIPVTHRGATSTVAFVTGHEDPKKQDTDINWDSLVGVGTIVFYMGMKNLSKIVEQLMKHGLPGETLIAVIRWGTTPQQQTVVGSLDDIIDRVTEAKLKAPCIIIVGDVVRLRQQLCWFEKKPLFGKRVLVTRTKEQAKAFSELLIDYGAQPVEIPAINITDPDSFENIDRAFSRLENGPGYDWVIFTSANGVKFFIKRMKALKKDIRILAGAKIAAIGPATAKAVKKLLVNIAEVYKTVLDTEAGDRLRQMILDKEIDIATFTSPSTVTNFIKQVGADYKELTSAIKIAVIGPVTADAIRDSGLDVDIMAEVYTIPGLVEAIVGKAGAKA